MILSAESGLASAAMRCASVVISVARLFRSSGAALTALPFVIGGFAKESGTMATNASAVKKRRAISSITVLRSLLHGSGSWRAGMVDVGGRGLSQTGYR